MSTSSELIKSQWVSKYLDSEPICSDDSDIIYKNLLEEDFFKKAPPPSPHQWLFYASDDREEIIHTEMRHKQLIALT